MADETGMATDGTDIAQLTDEEIAAQLAAELASSIAPAVELITRKSMPGVDFAVEAAAEEAP
ncbi:hypothetical protein G6M04_14330 [Agrobacterium rhizogenes]|uniref:hypothetical protein n=1 Tax=Rhizobium rhizogenes TaxID=359 RepID=UPI00157405C4|nr:hypothetical protein [Rhizobium rhizogenes]NTG48566.1 hypothetical protein [Rhizobium rhizogenes]